MFRPILKPLAIGVGIGVVDAISRQPGEGVNGGAEMPARHTRPGNKKPEKTYIEDKKKTDHVKPGKVRKASPPKSQPTKVAKSESSAPKPAGKPRVINRNPVAAIKNTRQQQQINKARSATESFDQGCFIEWCSDSDHLCYKRALEEMLGRGSVFQLMKMSGHMLASLSSVEKAKRLIEEGLTIEDTILRAFPYRKRAEKIIIGNMPIAVKEEDLIAALRPYCRVVSLAFEIVNCEGYSWATGNREAFILMNDGMKLHQLPGKVDIKSKGKTTPAFITHGVKCSMCHRQGHRRASCPRRVREERPTHQQTPRQGLAHLPPTTQSPSSAALTVTPPTALAKPQETPPKISRLPRRPLPSNQRLLQASQIHQREKCPSPANFVRFTSMFRPILKPLAIGVGIGVVDAISRQPGEGVNGGAEMPARHTRPGNKKPEKTYIEDKKKTDHVKPGKVRKPLAIGVGIGVVDAISRQPGEGVNGGAEMPARHTRPGNKKPEKRYIEDKKKTDHVKPGKVRKPLAIGVGIGVVDAISRQPGEGVNGGAEMPARHTRPGNKKPEKTYIEDKKKTYHVKPGKVRKVVLKKVDGYVNSSTKNASDADQAAETIEKNVNWADQVEAAEKDENTTPFIQVKKRKASPPKSQPTKVAKSESSAPKPAGKSRVINRKPVAAIKNTRQQQQINKARSATESFDQGCFIEWCSDFDHLCYMRALEEKLGRGSVFQLMRMSGHMLASLSSVEKAKRLIEEGLTIEDTILRAFPYRKRAEKIIFGNLPIAVKEEDLVAALRPYCKVVSLDFEIVNCEGYSWATGNREAFILMNDGMKLHQLPGKVDIKSKGKTTPAFITHGVKCSMCHRQGHRRASCPRRVREERPTHQQTPRQDLAHLPPTTQSPSSAALTVTPPTALAKPQETPPKISRLPRRPLPSNQRLLQASQIHQREKCPSPAKQLVSLSLLGRGNVVAYADDIVLFIRDDAQFELVPLIFEEFRMSSGVAVNFTKSCGSGAILGHRRANCPQKTGLTEDKLLFPDRPPVAPPNARSKPFASSSLASPAAAPTPAANILSSTATAVADPPLSDSNDQTTVDQDTTNESQKETNVKSLDAERDLCHGYSAVVVPSTTTVGSGLACVFAAGVVVHRQQILSPGKMAVIDLTVRGVSMTCINTHVSHAPEERCRQLQIIAALAIKEDAWILGDLNISEESAKDLASGSAEALAELLDQADLVDDATFFDAALEHTRPEVSASSWRQQVPAAARPAGSRPLASDDCRVLLRWLLCSCTLNAGCAAGRTAPRDLLPATPAGKYQLQISCGVRGGAHRSEGSTTPITRLNSPSARRALDAARLQVHPAAELAARWDPTVNVPRSISWVDLRRNCFSGYDADVALRLTLHALPHPDHPASRRANCAACASSDRSLAHRYWSCRAVRPLLREVFASCEMPLDLQAWLFGVGLHPEGMKITSVAKATIYKYQEFYKNSHSPPVAESFPRLATPITTLSRWRTWKERTKPGNVDVSTTKASKDRFLIASDWLIEQLIKADREDEEIEDVDIVQANLFGKSEGVLQKMEQLLAKPTVDRESIVSGGNEGKSNLHRLPKLELPKFEGEAREWLQFWSGFQSVHDDDSISACVKFQYLQNCMIKGSVSEEIVSSLPNLAANYPLAISTLEELRLSSQLRALGSLGVATDKCAAILYPMVELALPEDLFVAWERTRHHKPDEDGKHKSSEVLLEKLMEFLKHEIEEGERMRLARQPFSSSYPSQFNRDKPPKPKTSVATAASLVVSEGKSNNAYKCVFCDGKHLSEQCCKAMSMSLEERRKIIQEKRCCYSCLKPGNISKKCRNVVKCVICSRKHWAIVCPVSKGSQKSDGIEEKSKNIDASVDMSNRVRCQDVLLQTTMANINGENKSKVVRAMLDSGSQNSYVLEQTASEVGLTKLGKKEVVHLLFGGVKSRPQQHKRYRIYISDVDSKYNCNFEVQDCSTICSAMPSAQPAKWMTELRSKGIDLDVYRSNTEIELLLGADVYTKLITGKKQLESGPVALETKLGWTVSGKVLENVRTTESQSSVLSCLVRDATIQELWRLDVIGIRESMKEKSKEELSVAAFEHFNQTVKQNEDGGYSVNLPWIGGHPPLPNYKLISERKLESTTARLESSPFLLVAVIDHHLSTYEDEYKKTIDILRRSMYVDNCVASVGSKEDALNFKEESVEIFGTAKMDLREWENGPSSEEKQVTVLGLFWNLRTDELTCDFMSSAKKMEPGKVTRRKILSAAHSLFDSIGFTCPFTIIPKMLLQESYGVKAGWDTDLSKDISRRFNAWLSQLTEVDKLKIPRCVVQSQDRRTWTLHIFMDSSNAAFAACAYLRSGFPGSVQVQLDTVDYASKMTEILSDHTTFIPVVQSDVSTSVKTFRLKLLRLKKSGHITPVQYSSFISDLNSIPYIYGLPKTHKSGIPLRPIIAYHLSPAYKLSKYLSGYLTPLVKASPQSSAIKDIPSFVQSVNSLNPVLNSVMVSYVNSMYLSLPHQLIIGQLTKFLQDNHIDSHTIESIVALSSLCLDFTVFTFNNLYYKQIRGSPMGSPLSSPLAEIVMATIDHWIQQQITPGIHMWRRYIDDIFCICDTGQEISILNCLNSYHPEISFSLELEDNSVLPFLDILIIPIKEKFRDFSFKVQVQLHMARSRVAPMKNTTIPRLELVACEIGSRLAVHIKSMMEFEDIPTTLWTDSTTSLSWIKRDMNWSVFVAGRVKKIRQNSSITDWRHVPGKENPADIPSRGASISQLITTRWWEGPVWLKKEEQFWTQSVEKESIEEVNSELKKAVVTHFNIEKRDILAKITQVFNYHKIILMVAYWRRFLDWLQRKQLCTSLTTETFIGAMRRFVARRGRPSTIYSDNGLNFVGCKNLFSTLDWNKIVEYGAINRISWKFNPPTACWWGGFWERMIGIVKQLLRSVLGSARVTNEELQTLLCDVEALVNNRPLTYVSEDDDELPPLTPNKLINNCGSSILPEADEVERDSM
ncbi:hypothetical protein LAZ67_15000707, partial [Cordylochernes scorpioides]